MIYGQSVPALFHRAAIYLDKILKGTKPADLPVEQPTPIEAVVWNAASISSGVRAWSSTNSRLTGWRLFERALFVGRSQEWSDFADNPRESWMGPSV
jgi:hypothetical protein